MQFVTGHDHKCGLPENVDLKALADNGATTIVYMPKKTIGEMSKKLIANGLVENTPALAIMDATLPSQLVIRGNIKNLPSQMEAANLQGAVLVMIGEVVADRI